MYCRNLQIRLIYNFFIFLGENEEDHVPTADKVTRVFSGMPEGAEDGQESSGDEEALEEIDFNDIGKIQAEVDAAAASRMPTPQAEQSMDETKIIEEKFMGFYVDTKPTAIPDFDAKERAEPEIQVDRVDVLLGQPGDVDDDDEDDKIVYDAPNPRSGAISPSIARHQETRAIREVEEQRPTQATTASGVTIITETSIIDAKQSTITESSAAAVPKVGSTALSA